MNKLQILIEIGKVNQSIQAFRNGMPWLSPDDYSDAPGVIWLEMQRNALAGKLKSLEA